MNNLKPNDRKLTFVIIICIISLFAIPIGIIVYKSKEPIRFDHEIIDTSAYNESTEETTTNIFQALMDTPTANDGTDYTDEYYDNKVDGDYIYRAAMGEEYKGYVCLVKYIGTDSDITLPEKLGGLPVITILPEAFAENGYVRKITIPDGNTEVDTKAFAYCTTLEEVIIPNTVTQIGNGAFSGCTSLKSIVLPDSITLIDAYAFDGCESLNSIILPDGLISIGNSAFSKCTSLTKMDIPDSVTSIGERAFSQCTSLKHITLGKGITQLPPYTFSLCESLVNVSIKGRLASIGDGVFADSGLSEFDVPEGVEEIGSFAFNRCENLKRVSIPSSARTIAENLFANCVNIESIDVSPENSKYYSVDGVLFDRSAKSLIKYPSGRSGSYSIPDGITTICANAFAQADELSDIDIPDSVVQIGDYAFEDADIKSVVIPDSVTVIGVQAFVNCRNLASAQIGKNVSSIGEGVLGGCINLATVSIDSGCTKYSYKNGFLIDEEQNLLLAVAGKPSGKLSIPGGITRVGEFCAYRCGITFLELPASVETIGRYAFAECSNLTDISFGGNEKTIEYYAFSDCTSLTEIKLPDSVTVLNQRAFSNCTSIKEFKFSENLEILESYVLTNCSELKSIVIPNSVIEIKPTPFDGCDSLERIILSDNLEKIFFSAFDTCTSLRELYFPSCIEFATTVVSYDSLERIYYGGSERDWQINLNIINDYNDELDNVEFVFNAERPTE